MKILITGGAGFIGSHIAKLLLDQGDEVLIYDNLATSKKDSLDSRSTFIQGDINNSKLLIKSLQGVDAVIHMASLIVVPDSVRDPLKYVENNVVGSVFLLEAMKSAGVKKIIFSSSACVYGVPEKLPITETERLKSDNPYGASKIAVEAFCETYHRTSGFDVTILRYFNPYGPGENHLPESHAIPNFVLAGLAKKPIPLYWNGEQVRDFIYVEDLAKAHIAVLKLSGFNIFNVGTEQGNKIIDILRDIEEVLGYSLEIKDLGERAGDVPANFASSKKLEQTTGWKAETDLKTGLEKTINYFKQKIN